MVFVGTRYDKDLKEKVFYVRESEAYTHSTTTSLSVDWSDNVFTLTAVVDNLLGKGLVKFYRDGVEVGEQYVTRTATLLLQSDTYDGVFIAKFMGNSDCLSSESSEVSYKPLPTPEFSIVTSGDLLVGGKVTVGSSLPSDATGTVKYLVNGAEYTKTVGESFTYSFSSSGSFTLTADYLGDSNYNVASASTTLVISKVGTVLSVSCDKEYYYATSTATVSVTVKDKDGGVLGGVSVSDGSSTQTTNSNGVASFTYENGSKGTVSKSYSFGGSDKYESSTGSVSWRVVLIPAVLTITSDKSSYTLGETATFTVSLKDENGNNVGNVNFELDNTVMGVVGSYTLGSDGTYTVTYVCDTVGSFTNVAWTFPTDVYKIANGSVSYSVVDSVVPELTLSGDTLVGEVGDSLSLSVASNLTSGTVSLVDNDDGTVYYTSTIASDGSAILRYECKGLGDKNLIAQYNNGSDIINSNIQKIEDCLFYDAFNKDTGKWINNNSTLTYSNTGLTIASKSYSDYSYILSKDSFDNVIIETSSPDWSNCQIGLCDNNNNYTVLYGTHANGSDINYHNTAGKSQTDTFSKISGGTVVKLVYHDSTSFEVYTDDVLVKAGTCTKKGQQIRIIGWGYGTNQPVKVSYVKVKPYTSE